MPTYTALATLDDEPAAYALSDALEALDPTGVGAFEIEDGSGRWEVGGYFNEKPDDVALALLAAAHGATRFVVSEVGDTDWVAQVRRELSPVCAGRRFIVHGGHDRSAVPLNAVSLEIEAAMAFGTGHHGTTEGCLEAIDALRLTPGFHPRRIADIGCGTGVLAMAAARVWQARIIATDIDPVAAATARANFRANRIWSSAAVGRAPGFRHARIHALAPLDLVLANILARPLRLLAPDMARFTRSGARVVFSGVLERQIRFVLDPFENRGFALERQALKRGWATLTLRRF
ncbi:MAG: 50S ribosomal protein L11 methyltransferase [Pseudomonadota bacterium]